MTSASSMICCLIHFSCFCAQSFFRRQAMRRRFHASQASSQPSPQGSSPTGSKSSESSSMSFFNSCRFFAMSVWRHAGSSSCRTLAAFPIRTTLTPFFMRPMAMLSTAMLHSDVASKGLYPMVCTHFVMMRTDVWVFPVPGGPWTMVSRLDIELPIASRWAVETLGMDSTSRQATAKRSRSTPCTSSSASDNVLAFRSASMALSDADLFRFPFSISLENQSSSSHRYSDTAAFSMAAVCSSSSTPACSSASTFPPSLSLSCVKPSPPNTARSTWPTSAATSMSQIFVRAIATNSSKAMTCR
mmetsp:Transcript_71571/g.207233  ORF Transcript_71571/g.207233 Transcript_71571/m.207233 type:complete len:301 (+) Transcript_71571:1143-2045(+)